MIKKSPYELFREVVPLSNYDECEGCHTGTERCAIVHYLHRFCPCDGCMVKTSCTQYCDLYLEAVTVTTSGINNIHLVSASYKGITSVIKSAGQKLQFDQLLRRYNPNKATTAHMGSSK